MEETLWIEVQYRFLVPVEVSEEEYEELKKLEENSPVCDGVVKYAKDSLESLFNRHDVSFEDIGADHISSEDGEVDIEY